MKTDYTLTDEFREAVQVDANLSRLSYGDKVYVVHGGGGIHLGKNFLSQLYAAGAGQDRAAAIRLKAFEEEYTASQPVGMLSNEQIQAQVLRNRQQYEQARDVLAAQKAMPKPRILTQQDEQLNMAYRNGFDDGAVLGRMAMLRIVCKVAIAGLAAAMLAAFIILG